MQVIHSVIIHEGDSLSLAEIQRVVTLQRMGKDINEKERTHAFRNAFSLIILLIFLSFRTCLFLTQRLHF